MASSDMLDRSSPLFQMNPAGRKKAQDNEAESKHGAFNYVLFCNSTVCKVNQSQSCARMECLQPQLADGKLVHDSNSIRFDTVELRDTKFLCIAIAIRGAAKAASLRTLSGILLTWDKCRFSAGA